MENRYAFNVFDLDDIFGLMERGAGSQLIGRAMRLLVARGMLER